MTKEEVRKIVLEMLTDGTITFALNDKRGFYSDYLEIQLLLGIGNNDLEVISSIDIKLDNR